MSAAILNFNGATGAPKIEQGAEFDFFFEWNDKTGAKIDVSLYSAKMQIRKNYDEPVIVELSTDNGRIQVDSNNDFGLFLESEITDLILPGTYLYDLLLEDIISGDRFRLIQGEITVSPRVTV